LKLIACSPAAPAGIAHRVADLEPRILGDQQLAHLVAEGLAAHLHHVDLVVLGFEHAGDFLEHAQLALDQLAHHHRAEQALVGEHQQREARDRLEFAAVQILDVFGNTERPDSGGVNFERSIRSMYCWLPRIFANAYCRS
jgi:hypothetical protein